MIDEIRLLPNEIIGILYSINYFRLNEIRRKKNLRFKGIHYTSMTAN